jgi:hypothetical protein
MNFPVRSRAAIMQSAYDAFLSGKTVNDVPEAFKHYADVWRYEFEQCAFHAACTGDEVKTA